MLLWTGSLKAQEGDAARGARLLEERGCNRCHSAAGEAADSAPNLHRPSESARTPADLAAGMWNHGPGMWRALAGWNLEMPRLSRGEIADLYAYLFSRRFFEPGGDIEQGREVFVSKNCHRCHALVEVESAGIGPPVARWPATSDPVRWIQEMWNHASEMQKEFERDGIAYPVLTAGEMADMVAYVRDVPAAVTAQPTAGFGEADAGRRLFRKKGCADCHSIGTNEAGKIDLLSALERSPTLTSLAVAMWNHRPWMESFAGKELKAFRGDQMAQVLSYLLSQQHAAQAGSAERGRQVFEEQGCAACHARGNAGAPVLPEAGRTYDAFALAETAWWHGPTMEAEMDHLGLDWPHLDAQQAADLIAFLSGR